MFSASEQMRQNNKMFEHVTTIPPNQEFAQECNSTSVGCTARYHPNQHIISDLDKVWPVRKSSMTRDRLPSIEIFGNPFRAQGDGLMYNPDAWNKAWLPSNKNSRQQCNRILAEKPYNRFYCHNAPNAYEWKSWNGIDSRQGNMIFTPCDL